jgi:oxaloacetate decarboxylase (Na+ extruding) subunit alpha
MIQTRPVRISDTTLRDAHQSLWATRMRMGDMLPILERLDAVGYWSLEVWGGATFDAMLRFLDENPWERLRTIKKHVTKTPLQMLLRGQNLVGYRHYSDDVVRRFVHASARNGVDVFRVFDALNDIRNLEVPIEAAKATGKLVEGAISYTVSPVHTIEKFVQFAHELADRGCDTICIKDMAALLTPYQTSRLVEHLKREIDLPIHLHCHYIGGMAPMNYIKGIEAGADIIDTASTPLAFGNSQPAVEMIVAALKSSAYDTGLDLELLFEIAEYWDRVREKRGIKRGVTSLMHMKGLTHQVPGGMLSNLESQLADQKALDRMDDVLEEIPKVRAEVGYPPLVTPMSQIVATQAVLNVLTGKRWSAVPAEMRKYVKGLYGKPPGPMDPEIVARVLGGETPLADDVRPGSLAEGTYEQAEAEAGALAKSEEDVLMWALFPAEARAYLEAHTEGAESAIFKLGEEYRTVLEEETVDVNQIRDLIRVVESSDVDEVTVEEGGVRVTVRKGCGAVAGPAGITATPVWGLVAAVTPAGPATASSAAAPAQAPAPTHPDHWKTVTSPMVGTFYRSPSPGSAPFVEAGDSVGAGQTLCILEAMKLMNEISIEEPGTIREILVDDAAAVEYGTVLMVYEPGS